jgi:hypothetical protein
MQNFRDIFISKTGFVPRTQAQALKAYTEDIIGPEYYTYRAVNIHPLLEEPWDFQEIDRLLAKPDLDIETIQILITIFDKMLQLPDKEQALFAAESINALEQRYLNQIIALKKKAETDADMDTIRAILQKYQCLAAINKNRPLLRTFYQKEAQQTFIQYRDLLTDPEKDIAAYISLLFDLEAMEEARREILAALQKHPRNEKLHFLVAELNFRIRSYREVGTYMNQVVKIVKSKTGKEICDFWGIQGARHG